MIYRQVIGMFEFILFIIIGAARGERLIDIENFQFTTSPDICGGSPVRILFIISSAPDHFDFRQAQRETWANVDKYYAKHRFKVAYMLGELSDGNEEVKRRLKEERERHLDIVEGNIVDSYDNLTYKHVMGLKWAESACPQARYVIKADDDVYVDIFQLYDDVVGRFGESAQNLLVCGHLFEKNKPYRDVTNKYYVSYDEYSSDEPYPAFCSGAAIMYSMDVVHNMISASNTVTFFKLEDVYATSTLRRHLGLKPLVFDHPLQWNSNAVAAFIKDTKVQRGNFLFALTTKPEELYHLWDKLLNWFAQVNRMKMDNDKKNKNQ